jgi:two-component system, cell cycle sensor histidine kinase and response regulator CckA
VLYAEHKDKVSAVITDMMMPTMDGITAIRTLQKINPQVKIIASSGLKSSDKIAELDKLGVKKFLLKPYTAEELLITLHEVLNEN